MPSSRSIANHRIVLVNRNQEKVAGCRGSSCLAAPSTRSSRPLATRTRSAGRSTSGSSSSGSRSSSRSTTSRSTSGPRCGPIRPRTGEARSSIATQAPRERPGPGGRAGGAQRVVLPLLCRGNLADRVGGHADRRGGGRLAFVAGLHRPDARAVARLRVARCARPRGRGAPARPGTVPSRRVLAPTRSSTGCGAPMASTAPPSRAGLRCATSRERCTAGWA